MQLSNKRPREDLTGARFMNVLGLLQTFAKLVAAAASCARSAAACVRWPAVEQSLAIGTACLMLVLAWLSLPLVFKLACFLPRAVDCHSSCLHELAMPMPCHSPGKSTPLNLHPSRDSAQHCMRGRVKRLVKMQARSTHCAVQMAMCGWSPQCPFVPMPCNTAACCKTLQMPRAQAQTYLCGQA